MRYNFKPGQKLIVQLSTEVIEGEYLGGGENRLELINVSVGPGTQKIKGPLSYYQSEIKSVHVLNENGILNDENHLNTEVNGEATENIISDGLPTKVISLNQTEYERLKSMSQNFIYMTTIDSRYYSAMRHVNNCENVGVVCITTSLGKMAKLSLLVLSTWDQVYIFDMIMFNKKRLPLELTKVFESEFIKKVVHDSRLMVDLFNSCYKIKIQNIFDTQVADLFVRKQQNKGLLPTNVKNIFECLVDNLNFPSILLEEAQKTELKKFEHRPLSASRQYRASQLATYLITLKNHLETVLLQDFYNAIDVHSKSLFHCTVIESQKKIKSAKLSEMLNKLELKEFSSEDTDTS